MKKIYGKRQDFPTETIADGVYRVSDFNATDCYLIVGQERALLIDTGTCIGCFFVRININSYYEN